MTLNIRKKYNKNNNNNDNKWCYCSEAKIKGSRKKGGRSRGIYRSEAVDAF